MLPDTYICPAETGFYSLQSRYYDPEIGRFINADAIINYGNICGYNLFSYCYNNPIRFADSSGALPDDQLLRLAQEYNNGAYIHMLGGRKASIKIPTESLTINSFKNKDGSYSLYDNRRHNPNSVFHEQILSGKASKPSLSLKDGTATLGSASATFMTGGWEFKHLDLSLLDIGQAKIAAGVNNGQLDITAMASAWAPSATTKVWNVNITIAAHVGSIGGKINVGSGKFDVGAAYGLGASLSIDW